ncbi:entericidin A/B family lipoprotein [Alcaligenaceae bacterium CGII-47]|nr:entericidin A/B family lipoprotein [Alcaligenaceae bacterium CGII-47]
MSTRILTLFALLGCLIVAGCANTVAGAGEDISNAGQAITKATK